MCPPLDEIPFNLTDFRHQKCKKDDDDDDICGTQTSESSGERG